MRIEVGDAVRRTGPTYEGVNGGWISRGTYYVVAEVRDTELRVEGDTPGQWWDIDKFDFVSRSHGVITPMSEGDWWDVEAEAISVKDPETGYASSWAPRVFAQIGLEVRVQLRRKP